MHDLSKHGHTSSISWVCNICCSNAYFLVATLNWFTARLLSLIKELTMCMHYKNKVVIIAKYLQLCDYHYYRIQCW